MCVVRRMWHLLHLTKEAVRKCPLQKWYTIFISCSLVYQKHQLESTHEVQPSALSVVNITTVHQNTQLCAKFIERVKRKGGTCIRQFCACEMCPLSQFEWREIWQINVSVMIECTAAKTHKSSLPCFKPSLVVPIFFSLSQAIYCPASGCDIVVDEPTVL